MSEAAAVPANRGKNRGGVPPVEHRFKPGQSGNPFGRPRKITKYHEALPDRELPDVIRQQLKPLGFKGKTWGAAYAFGAGVQAIKGDIPALKEITDRVEGKVAQPITGADGSPLIPERASLVDEAARLLELVAGRTK